MINNNINKDNTQLYSKSLTNGFLKGQDNKNNLMKNMDLLETNIDGKKKKENTIYNSTIMGNLNNLNEKVTNLQDKISLDVKKVVFLKNSALELKEKSNPNQNINSFVKHNLQRFVDDINRICKRQKENTIYLKNYIKHLSEENLMSTNKILSMQKRIEELELKLGNKKKFEENQNNNPTIKLNYN